MYHCNSGAKCNKPYDKGVHRTMHDAVKCNNKAWGKAS